MNPWLPEKDSKKLRRLGKTGEELAELQKVINRMIIQGSDGVDPSTGKSNIQSLAEEIADVICQVSLTAKLFDLDGQFISNRVVDKAGQMGQWDRLVKDFE